MEFSKIHELNDGELKSQEAQTGEQLFRIRFQKSLGNNDGISKLRELKKDIARFKTVARQRELGHAVAPVADAASVKKSRKVKA